MHHLARENRDPQTFFYWVSLERDCSVVGGNHAETCTWTRSTRKGGLFLRSPTEYWLRSAWDIRQGVLKKPQQMLYSFFWIWKISFSLYSLRVCLTLERKEEGKICNFHITNAVYVTLESVAPLPVSSGTGNGCQPQYCSTPFFEYRKEISGSTQKGGKMYSKWSQREDYTAMIWSSCYAEIPLGPPHFYGKLFPVGGLASWPPPPPCIITVMRYTPVWRNYPAGRAPPCTMYLSLSSLWNPNFHPGLAERECSLRATLWCNCR